MSYSQPQTSSITRQIKLFSIKNWSIASALLLLLLSLLPVQSVRAEGSWQMGLFEGLSNRQPLLETNVNAGRSILKVDILSVGEVINVLACGTDNNSNVRVRIFDPFGTRVYNTTQGANIDCNDAFLTTFDPGVTNAHQHVTTSTGVYEIHLTNFNGTFLNRFDVTVTDTVNDIIDPKASGGRLWSDFWYFWAGSFAQSASTDADLFVVADGGFTNTFFVWKLDLNNFAGFGYGLKANNLGVVSPNAAGDVVAGLSVPSAGNAVDQQYPIYLSYPARDYPLPTQGFTVSPLVFLDSDNIDAAITSGGDGSFFFSTDYTSTAVYEIIIDVGSETGGGPDGVYGRGDIFLRGIATPGDNVVAWNGRDNNGVVVPLGAYTAEVSIRTGEFHFAADDVETSGGPGDIGLKIFQANRNGTDTPTTIYWDDFTVLNSTTPNAFNQVGIFDGDHNWGAFNSGGIGNVAFIDTYAFGISESPPPIGIAVVPDDTPLASISKSFTPPIIPHGGISNMQFEIVNNGATALSGVTVTDTMPFGMTLVTDPASISVTGTGCSGFTFSPDTVVGGDQLNIIDGSMSGNSTCVVSADVTAVGTGELVNATSGVITNEIPFGVASNSATLTVEPQSSGTPFACDATLYELEDFAGATRLYSIDRGTVPFTRSEFSGIGYSPSTGFRYSGLAYHPTDNYLYGIVTESDQALGDPVVGSVVRIDSDGAVANLGVPETGPNAMGMPVVSDQFVGGTFNAAGDYIVVTDNSTVSNAGVAIPAGERGLVLQIDVSVSPPQVLVNRSHGRNVGDIVAHPDGLLYSHTPAEGLITIDSQSGAVNVLGGSVTNSISSLMADNWGQLFAHTESTDELLLVDPANGNGTAISNLPGGASADGASCAYGVSMRKSVADAEIEPGNSTLYSIDIVNAGNSAASFDLLDDLQDARTFVPGSLINPLNGTVNNYGGNSLLSISNATLAPNSSATLQFEVLFPGGAGTSLNQSVLQQSGAPPVLSDYPATPVYGDATPIEILASPGVGISKSAQVNGNEIAYFFHIENPGSATLQSLELSDDLDAVFGAGNYHVTAPPVLIVNPGSVVLNPTFTGSGPDTVIIDPASNSSLEEGERAVIRLAVVVDNVVDTGLGPGVYSNQVTLAANTAAGSSLSDLSVDGDNPDPNDDGISDEQSPTIVTLINLAVVGGTVFSDNGASAVAHDGTRSGTEQPLAGVVVELRDSTGLLIDSVVTATDGSYTIDVPQTLAGTPLQLVTLPTPGYQPISEQVSAGVVASVTDGAVTFTPSTGAQTYQIDFGRVRAVEWLSSNIAENAPNTVVFHPHRFQSYSSGDVTFQYSSKTGSPANTGWTAVLYIDDNCNGLIDSGETTASGSYALSIDSGSQLCVVSKVNIPADVNNDDTYRTVIEATFSYSDDAATGHALSSTLELTDITRALSTGQGVLVLAKTVQNVTEVGAAVISNSATPDDVLRYSIEFNNHGTGPVTEVLIADNTPAYSSLEQPVQCPGVLPAGIVNCEVLIPSIASNVAGYNGPVQWQFNGSLTAGAGGTVWFEIRVD